MSYNYDQDGQPCCPQSGPCSAHDVLEPCPHICPSCAKCPDCCNCPGNRAARILDRIIAETRRPS